MFTKFVAVLALAVAASALPIAEIVYHETPAQYNYQYSVQDGHSGDVKQQQEARTGDAVHGSYSLVQPDGVQRIVEYTADKVNGFNAVVSYKGHPIEAPAKVAYAAPVKVAYNSPVAYAAPAAKVVYSAPLGHVSYSSPAVSYQH